ncbi:alpha/beta hydrolase fold [Streptomyces sp. Ncost-T10-10d]|nr:alpha/beta hydrolase fold [Streptomyces sp. Ncost-T10-10d]
MPLTKSEVMGEVADRYDLIGVDPRFVGRSTPLDCGRDLRSALLRSADADLAAYREEVAVARELAGRCERAHGDVLPYVTTRNTARDMDVIRAALGEDTLSYLGYSYGSYLGEVYTALPRPHRPHGARRSQFPGALQPHPAARRRGGERGGPARVGVVGRRTARHLRAGRHARQGPGDGGAHPRARCYARQLW